MDRYHGIDFKKDFNIHTGFILSGDEDIVSIDRAQSLYNELNALAVAWEGAGGARAAKFNNISYLQIRGITDNARTDVPESFVQNLPKVMSNIAGVIEGIPG